MPPEGASRAEVPDAVSAAAARRPFPRRWAVAFGRFWWDFLVGDTPELLVGVLLALGVLALLVRASSLNAPAVAAFPALVVALLALSVNRARRQRGRTSSRA